MRLQRDGFSIDAAARKGRKFPDWYLDQPAIFPGDEFYLRAFYHLSSCRRFQGGPIPWELIAQYAAGWQLAPDMVETFATVIPMMDNAYLEWWEAENKKRDSAGRRTVGKGGKSDRHRKE